MANNSKPINGTHPTPAQREATPGEMLQIMIMKLDEAQELRAIAVQAAQNPNARIDREVNGIVQQATPSDAIAAAQAAESQAFNIFVNLAAHANKTILAATRANLVDPKKAGR